MIVRITCLQDETREAVENVESTALVRICV